MGFFIKRLKRDEEVSNDGDDGNSGSGSGSDSGSGLDSEKRSVISTLPRGSSHVSSLIYNGFR